MKLILFAASAALMFGQDAKIIPTVAAPTPNAVANERPFTKEESLAIENSMLRISLARKTYKIDEFETEVAPAANSQTSIITAACKSIGIPDEKVKGECGIQGFGADGKELTGPDGKVIPRRVWWNKPALKLPAVEEKK